MAKGKKQQIKVEGTWLTIVYPTIRKELRVDVAGFDAEVKFAAMMHGFKQKYGDVESGGTPAEKYEMLQRVVEANRSGGWDIGAGARDTSGIVIEAVCRLKELDPAKVTASLDKLSVDDRTVKVKEWASNPKVKAMVARIRADRAEAAADDSDEDDIEV